MSPGAYSVQFDATRATLKRPKLVELLHNGQAIGVHASEADANETADRLSKTCGTKRECFSVRGAP